MQAQTYDGYINSVCYPNQNVMIVTAILQKEYMEEDVLEKLTHNVVSSKHASKMYATEIDDTYEEECTINFIFSNIDIETNGALITDIEKDVQDMLCSTGLILDPVVESFVDIHTSH